MNNNVNCNQFVGKYRGTVINNVDPKQSGRVQVIVPDVTCVLPGTWAMPAMPIAGIQMGMFSVPPIGSGVWVEFEQGNPDFPIWTGGFWGSAAEVPSSSLMLPPAVPGITMQTPLQSTIQVSDMQGPTGGIQLRSGLAMITVNTAGILITNGTGASIFVAPTGPSIVVNQGALTIT